MQAAYEAKRPDQVETLKTELQSVRFALGKMGERIPVARTCSLTWSSHITGIAGTHLCISQIGTTPCFQPSRHKVIRETSQILPEEPILTDVLFYSSTVSIQQNTGPR